MHMAVHSLPIIDFSNPDRLSNARDLTEAMETIGFVYLDNVPGFNQAAEERLLECVRWFFSLPLEDKLRLSPKNWNKDSENVYRGYVPVNVAEGHLREQYETGEDLPVDDADVLAGIPFYEPTPWPQCDSVGFRETMAVHYRAMIDAGVEFMRLTSVGLGLAEHTFDSRFQPRSVSSLRVMHYPTYGRSEPTYTCEEHIDGAFVTFLVTFSYPGLEVKAGDGSWIAVVPCPGSLVVNIGDLLSRLTNRRFKATRHRVRDLGINRYSVPFFFEPQCDARFEFQDDSSVITYGLWMLEKMRKFTYQYGHVPDFTIST